MPKRKTPPKRVATKRQLATWQRQQRSQKITLFSGLAVIVIVLALVGYGYYDYRLKPLYQPVVRVNDTVRNVKFVASMLHMQAPGYKPEELAHMVDQVTTKIENAELMAQAARKLNIAVSAEEVERKILDSFSAGPEGKTLSDDEALKKYQQMLAKYKISDADFKKVNEVNVLQDKLRDHLAKQVPTAAPQVKAMAILVSDEEDAVKARRRVEQGEDFVKVATDVSLLPVSKGETGDLGWVPQGLLTAEFDRTAFNMQPGSLSQPVWDDEAFKRGGYFIAQVWQREDDRSFARGILLGTRKEAEEVRAKLVAGEDFVKLVKERSQDDLSKSYDGQMGAFSKSDTSTDFDKALMALEVNTWSAPMFKDRTVTKGGYWIVKVTDKDQQKELENDTRDALINKAFSEWLEKERKASNIERYLDESKVALVVKLASS